MCLEQRQEMLAVSALVRAWCALQTCVDLENPSYNLAIGMRVHAQWQRAACVCCQ